MWPMDWRQGVQPALKNFSLALERDPKMATGYVNRGFVLNDLKDPRKSSDDFKTALKLQPSLPRYRLSRRIPLGQRRTSSPTSAARFSFSPPRARGASPLHR